MKNSVQELDAWLKYKTPINLWLPTLDLEADIKVSRLDLIEISGNHCKHNLSRLTRVSKLIHKILNNNNNENSVSLEKIPLALDDFRTHLQDNYFIYYGTYLSEMLNNIRWGIQNYLQPTYKVSYKKDDYNDMKYSYEYPAQITQEIPRQWFWRLMNNIRTGPPIKKFTCARYLKNKSSLEWR
ncbi:MAG: hypothetical protein GXZ13_00490 [Synergistaceae bacterium]|nr:hypothetical protein [Synergistaceae bacterium]